MDKKKILKALKEIEATGKPIDQIVRSMEEGIEKGYRKNVDIPDLLVRAHIDTKTGDIKVFQQYTIVEDVEDDELEISLKDAQEINPEFKLGDLVEKEVDINDMRRASASLAKNVFKQKNREAEKQKVYDDYIGLLNEMVPATVSSVEEKFTLVVLSNAGSVTAVLPRAAQIPGEILREGEIIPVIITSVNKDTKGAQILVSRASEKLVERLFEREVTEIFDGTVEIKAIAREAGERTKMAVMSNNPEVDARGACIGMQGMRVQQISNQLCGEKIDIFEWSSDIGDLVKNALAPADVIAVFPTENEKELLVVVDEDQLSLAIGKKGKNSRLAAKLTKMKIDIKTKAELAEAGKDFDTMMLEYQANQERLRREEQSKKIAAMNAELEAQEKALAEKRAKAAENSVEVEDTKEEVKRKKKVKREAKEKADYVSRFEKLVDTSKTKEQPKEDKRRKKKDKDEDERKLKSSEIAKNVDYEIKPEYSEEELEEIRAQQEQEEQEAYSDDIDYDEFEDYYDKD